MRHVDPLRDNESQHRELMAGVRGRQRARRRFTQNRGERRQVSTGPVNRRVLAGPRLHGLDGKPSTARKKRQPRGVSWRILRFVTVGHPGHVFVPDSRRSRAAAFRWNAEHLVRMPNYPRVRRGFPYAGEHCASGTLKPGVSYGVTPGHRTSLSHPLDAPYLTMILGNRRSNSFFTTP